MRKLLSCVLIALFLFYNVNVAFGEEINANNLVNIDTNNLSPKQIEIYTKMINSLTDHEFDNYHGLFK